MHVGDEVSINGTVFVTVEKYARLEEAARALLEAEDACSLAKAKLRGVLSLRRDSSVNAPERLTQGSSTH